MKKLFVLFTCILAAVSTFAAPASQETLEDALSRQIKQQKPSYLDRLLSRRAKVEVFLSAFTEIPLIEGKHRTLPETVKCDGLILTEQGLVLLGKECAQLINKPYGLSQISFTILGAARGTNTPYNERDLKKAQFKSNGSFGLYRMSPVLKIPQRGTAHGAVSVDLVKTSDFLKRKIDFTPIFTEDEVTLQDFEKIFKTRPDKALKEFVSGLALQEELEALTQ